MVKLYSLGSSKYKVLNFHYIYIYIYIYDNNRFCCQNKGKAALHIKIKQLLKCCWCNSVTPFPNNSKNINLPPFLKNRSLLHGCVEFQTNQQILRYHCTYNYITLTLLYMCYWTGNRYFTTILLIWIWPLAITTTCHESY